ncbi:MAG: SDR family oxidoreductase [Gammaproteobacteria bacterium]|nr:SDR family oxidoreductase [Gammaproteobacteria bacterium]
MKQSNFQPTFSDKVVVITGGAGGLGKALCDILCAANAKVALLDLSFPKEPLVLEPSSASNVVQLECDICEIAQVNQAIAKITELWGKIDFLINNAGITHMSRFEDTDTVLVKKIMDVNFMGSVHVTQACLPYLQKNQGHIVAISSVAGFSPLYGRTAYAASKHAMEGFFSSLAAEQAENNVDISIICPSFVATRPELTMSANQGAASPGAAKKNQVGRTLTPEQAASEICRCIQEKHKKMYLGGVSKLAKLLHTLFPDFYRKQMTKTALKEFE